MSTTQQILSRHRLLLLLAATVLACGLATPVAQAQAHTGGTPKPSGARSPEPVTLNFVNAEIESVARAISVMINRPIVVDPRVKAPITLYAERPIPVSEAYLNFLTALRGSGFSMVESGGLLKILPEAEAKIQAGTVHVNEVTTRGD